MKNIVKCENCVYRNVCEDIEKNPKGCKFGIETPKEYYEVIKPIKVEIKPTVSDYVRDFFIGYGIGLAIGITVKAIKKMIKKS